MKYTQYLRTFFENEKAGGICLIVCTTVSLVLANLIPSYVSFWQKNLASHDVVQWINDGLMAVFFLVVGLELKRHGPASGYFENGRIEAFERLDCLAGTFAPREFKTSQIEFGHSEMFKIL